MKAFIVLALLVQAEKPKTGEFKKPYGKTYALLQVPAAYAPAKKHALIVMLHGAGGKPEMYAPVYRAATRKDAIVLLPAARPKTAEEAARTTYDEEDTKLVFEMIEDAMKAYAIDRDRVFLSGHSAGAAYSFWLVSQRPDLFTACAAGASGLRFEASAMKDASHVPFYIVCGRKDPYHAEARDSVKPLQDLGFEVKFDDPADWTHSLNMEAWARMLAWFEGLCPPEQAALLQSARAAFDRDEPDTARSSIEKLKAMKSATAYAKKRAELLIKGR